MSPWSVPAVLMVLGAALVTLAVLVPIWSLGLLNQERFLDSLRYHAVNAGRSRVSLYGPGYLVKFGSEFPWSLASWPEQGWSGGRVDRAGRTCLCCPALSLLLEDLGHLSANLVPLAIPVCLLAGPGILALLQWLGSAVRPWRPGWRPRGLWHPAPEIVVAVRTRPPGAGMPRPAAGLLRIKPGTL